MQDSTKDKNPSVIVGIRWLIKEKKVQYQCSWNSTSTPMLSTVREPAVLQCQLQDGLWYDVPTVIEECLS